MTNYNVSARRAQVRARHPWRKGKYKLFYACRTFNVSDTRQGDFGNIPIQKGDVIEFDGWTLMLGDEKYNVPKLRGAIAENPPWLVEVNEDDDLDNMPDYVPQPADVQMTSSDHLKYGSGNIQRDPSGYVRDSRRNLGNYNDVRQAALEGPVVPSLTSSMEGVAMDGVVVGQVNVPSEFDVTRITSSAQAQGYARRADKMKVSNQRGQVRKLTPQEADRLAPPPPWVNDPEYQQYQQFKRQQAEQAKNERMTEMAEAGLLDADGNPVRTGPRRPRRLREAHNQVEPQVEQMVEQGYDPMDDDQSELFTELMDEVNAPENMSPAQRQRAAVAAQRFQDLSDELADTPESEELDDDALFEDSELDYEEGVIMTEVGVKWDTRIQPWSKRAKLATDRYGKSREILMAIAAVEQKGVAARIKRYIARKIWD